MLPGVLGLIDAASNSGDGGDWAGITLTVAKNAARDAGSHRYDDDGGFRLVERERKEPPAETGGVTGLRQRLPVNGEQRRPRVRRPGAKALIVNWPLMARLKPCPDTKRSRHGSSRVMIQSVEL
jgi:hypothetical protein